MNTHLTEDERQSAADGTIAGERAAAASAHLARCESCAADVARLKALMARVHDLPAPPAPADDLWPGIRSRISARNVIGWRAARWYVPALAAAAILVAAVLLRDGPQPAEPSAVSAADSVLLVSAEDTSSAYLQQVTELLNELELHRAMLRPETASAFDHDLRVIDQAIAELKDALARDPGNPALRKLLAITYRHKLELLKRVGNAS